MKQGKRALLNSEDILLIDPIDMSILESGRLNIPRCWHVAEVVYDKWVLVAGGSIQVKIDFQSKILENSY